MIGVRRTALAVEAQRRVTERRVRLGAEIRRSRQARRWSQAVLARQAGIGRMVVSRMERGLPGVDLDALERVALALRRPLILELGRDSVDGPADAGHLAMQELVLRVGRAAGYRGSFELTTRPADPWRSTDVGLADDRRRRMILIECWNSLGNVGAAARSSERKRAEAEGLAAARWGERSSEVSVCWVVRATARNRETLARYPEVFGARFPGSSSRWVGALTSGVDPPSEPGLVWCDVDATRLFPWRRAAP